MKPELIIKNSLSAAFEQLYKKALPATEIALQPTKKEFEGTYTFVTFPFSKLSGQNPEATAQQLGQYLKENCEIVAGFNVVKGFLNLELKEEVWVSVLSKEITREDFGVQPSKGKKVMVEYSSPNTNKPLHLGHLRNNFLGYSVAEILKANGYDVTKANLVNDRGIHICKSMVAYELFGKGETPQSSGMKGDHLAGKYYVEFDKTYREEVKRLMSTAIDEEQAKKEAPIMIRAQEMLRKWEEGDKTVVDLWKKMNGWVYEGFDVTYKKIGVNFDKFYYESDTYLLGKEVVEDGLKKGVFFKKDDNSVWVDLTSDGLDEKLLLRGDGTSVYITQDLGTADLKYKEFKVDQSIYVVGNEQDYHFNVLKLILKKMQRPYADGVYHLSYGMVDLPSGRMKSREGTVVDADDLIAEMEETAAKTTKELGKIEGFSEKEAADLFHMIGLGALKFFLLKVDPKKRMLFNPEESIEFQGFTGPFMQYTHARIASILRKASQNNIAWDSKSYEQLTSVHPFERDLVVMLYDYSKKIQEAGAEYSPSVIAQYVYDVAKEYNRFYAELPIFNESDPAKLSFRVALSAATARTIKKAMLLLGIEVPERM